MPPKQAQSKHSAKPPQARRAAAASAASSSSAPRASPASTLYADVVHSLFSFLALKDLARASASCKWWRSCMMSLPSGGNHALTSLSFVSLSAAAIPGMAASPLTRRVTSLTVAHPLSLRQFHALSAMGSLLFMDAWMGGRDAADKPPPRDKHALLPPALTSLNLRFGDGLLEPRMIAAAGESETLRHLGLLLKPYTNFWYPQLDLSPLCRSSSLTALQLDPVPSTEQLAPLKAMTTLHRFLVPRDYWFVSDLWPGLRMDLHHFESKSTGVHSITLETLAAHAPNLTQLPSGYFFQDALPVLSSLKKLKLLRMQPGLPAQHRGDCDRNMRFNAKEVIDSLTPCAFLPLLQLLCLERLDGLTSAQLLTLTPQLGSLLILQLSALTIDSLSFLAPLRLLRQLHLIACTDELPVAELSHALALPALERMHIAQSPWDRDAVMSLIRSRLPHMRCFAFDGAGQRTCCPRDGNPLHDLNPDECQMTVPTRDRASEW